MAASKKTSSATKAPATKAAATKTPAKKAPAQKAPAAKKAPATKTPAKKAPAQKAPAATKAPATKTPAKKAPATKAPATKTPTKNAPAAKKAPATKTPAKKAAVKETPATTSSAASNETAAKKAPASSARPAPVRKPKQPGPTSLTPSLLSNAKFERVEIPAPRGHTKDGIAYTKDFDVKFLKDQRDELLARRAAEVARATRLEEEATSIIEDGEMGDVQFDDEGGEGDTMVVQRDLDRVISTQARQTILEIDAALERISLGTYGYSEVSGQPIQRERLEAIPETTVLAAEKVSGVGPR
jgi:RNA polymerase-binding transcription factor DksA